MAHECDSTCEPRYTPGSTITAHGTTFTVVATPESHPHGPPRKGDSVLSPDDGHIVTVPWDWPSWDRDPFRRVVVHRAERHPFIEGKVYGPAGFDMTVRRRDDYLQFAHGGTVSMLNRDVATTLARDILAYYGED